MQQKLSDFLAGWANLGHRLSQNTSMDAVHDADGKELALWKEDRVARLQSWADVINDPHFGDDKDPRLQLRLVPQPFMGDLANAKVIILLLNPGLALADFHAEFVHREFRNALIGNLVGKRTGRDSPSQYPFLFLDPEWGWTSGYDWWFSRLKGVIRLVSQKRNIPALEAQALVASSVASIELLAYHSKSRPDIKAVLPSSRQAVALAQALHLDGRRIIVTRSEKDWGFKESDHNVWLNPMPISVRFTVSEKGKPLGLGDRIAEAVLED